MILRSKKAHIFCYQISFVFQHTAEICLLFFRVHMIWLMNVLGNLASVFQFVYAPSSQYYD